MGRRSINTTKSGKFMNPTDQARKEARKKELKKNKKQRQLVRAAVLKGKDPSQILEEMEKIDQMEFNVLQPSPLNEKVLKEKRRKLKETLDRVLKMYNKDEPEKWVELRRAKNEYERKRFQLIQFYESVKTAQQVTIDEIPLPQIGEQPMFPPSQFPTLAASIPLPGDALHTIESVKTQRMDKKPPGVPPGPPPDLNEYEDINELAAVVSKRLKEAANKPTSLQQRMVALSGQNIDDFMKEMEEKHSKRGGKENDSKTNKTGDKSDEEDGSDNEDNERDTNAANVDAMTSDIVPPGVDPTEMGMFRPPPLLSVRIPPGPPPGLPPRLGMRLPPGPPPGAPPRMPVRMPPIAAQQAIAAAAAAGGLHASASNVLSAGPQLISRDSSSSTSTGSATISAKPQIKNINADVTRFVPSTLRVRREDKKPRTAAGRAALLNELRQQDSREMTRAKAAQVNQPTKDDAYMQFMQEMQGLL